MKDMFVPSLQPYLDGTKTITVMAEVDVVKAVLNEEPGYRFKRATSEKPYEKNFIILKELVNIEKADIDLQLKGYIGIIDKAHIMYQRELMKVKNQMMSKK